MPYCLDAAWANGAFAGRRTAAALLLGGAAATTALVLGAGYPASMVGVPGAPVSNLNPPTLAAVCFGLAQCGAALLLRGPLRRAMRRPLAWAAVALLNLSAMTVFLWHQTALLAVTAAGMTGGHRLLGLHTVPDDLEWVAARIAWLPVFAVVLAVCLAAFRNLERPGDALAWQARWSDARRGMMCVMSEQVSDVKVTVRELQRNASAVLHRIEEGATVTVTRHGRSVARIVPPDPAEEAVDKAIADGLLDASRLPGAWSAAETARLLTAPPVAGEEPLSATLEQLREEDGDR